MRTLGGEQIIEVSQSIASVFTLLIVHHYGTLEFTIELEENSNVEGSTEQYPRFWLDTDTYVLNVVNLRTGEE